MAEGGRGVQKLVSKIQNQLPFRPTNLSSGSDSDDEYKEDDLYAKFRVSEMFSDEYDEYYEESVRRVERHFQNPENESEDDDYEYDNVVVDSPPSPGINSMAGKRKPYLAATASDQVVESSTGGGEPTFSFSRRSFDDDDDVVTDCVSPGKHGKDFGGTGPPADVAEFLKSHGDCLDPTPSPASSTCLRPPGGAEGGPDDMQRYTRSEGDANPRVRRTGAYGGPDDIQRYTRSEGSIHPRRAPPNFRTVAQRDRIVATARKLAELGNDINKQYEDRIRAAELKEPSYWQKLTSCIRTVTGAIDATATWVEHHSKQMVENAKDMKDMQKQEGVLRGLFLLTDISRRVNSIAVVQMACQYLDAPDEAFEAQRNAVRISLDRVGREIDNISETVETACELLRQIIKQCDSEDRPQFQKITLEFDNAVREANLAIRSCDQRLEKADKIIKDLLFKINSVRWFHRGLRCAGFGLTAYYFYGKYCDGSINRPTAVLASCCGLVAWLAMFPTKTYEYYEQLSELQYKHDEMRQQLSSLRENLHSAKEHKKSVTKR